MAELSPAPQPRRSFLRIVAIAATIALAGCQGMIPKGKPAPDAAPPPAPTTSLPQDDTRNRVALLVPMTGGNAAVGQSISNAANMALIDTGGKTIRITTYDTAPGAAAAAKRALDDGNRLILGPLLADDVKVVAPAARARGVPVVSFSNDATVAGNGVYLLGFSPAQSVERIVRYARSKGMANLAALVPSGVYGRNASNTLLRAAEDSGAKVVSLQTFDRSPKSLTDAIARLKANAGGEYQAVLIADGGRIAMQAVPQIRKQGGAGARVLGTELWATESALVSSPAMNGAWYASVSDTMYRQLAAKYRARFGKSPYRLSSLGYDAALLAVRIGADWKPGTAFPTRRLLDKDGFSGIDGAFRFGADGVAERTLAVHQVGAGTVTIVDAPPRGFGE
jgi:branched-chain amino acid transport system substrate-binding protein